MQLSISKLSEAIDEIQERVDDGYFGIAEAEQLSLVLEAAWMYHDLTDEG